MFAFTPTTPRINNAIESLKRSKQTGKKLPTPVEQLSEYWT